MNYRIIVWLLALIFIGQPCTYAQEEFPHVAGDILIRVKSQHSIQWIVRDLEWHKGLSTQIQARELLSDHMNIWRFTFNKDIISHNAMLEIVLKHPSVHNAQLNYIMEERVTPNDSLYSPQQWQYEQGTDFDIDATAAWDITTGGVTALGDTIVVCVVDGGLQVTHPDWGNNIWRNWGEVNGNGVDDDGNGYIDDYRGWNADNNNNNILGTGTHGTPVAGIVAAKGNNNIGVSGVNWNVKMMFVVGGGSASDAIVAYSYPLECRKLYNQTNGTLGAFVVATNSSWGIDNQPCATYAPLVNELYDTLGAYGVLSAAATANANTNVDVQGDFPTSCSSDYLISVTNMNNLGNKVIQAGYGQNTIDLGAYGEGTYTITAGSGYGGFGGTSGATPHVAGAIGLLYSAPCPRLALLARTQPAQTALMIKQIILNSSVYNSTLAGSTPTVSEGVLNLKNALDSVMAMGCSLAGCHEPYSILASSTVGISALVHWDRVDSTNLYHLMYRVVGSSTWTSATASDTFLTINGLIACTNYEVQIAANCDTTNYSTSYIFKTGDCCYAPTTITTGVVNMNDASFSWNADPFVNVYMIEYKLQSASVWSSVTTTNTSITLNGLDSCAYYDFRIISTCPVNVNNQYSSNIVFETVGCGKCTSTSYCTSAGQVSVDDWLERVSFESINNITGDDGGYASFVNSGPTTDVAQGGSYPITVALGYNTGPWGTNWKLKVWIDYNQDEIFNDTTELVYDAGQISTATAIHTGTVNIPATANLSRTRMRVAMKWGTSTLNPCASSNYGETEDYCINITTPTATNNVKNLINSTLNVYPNPFDNHLMLDVNSIVNQESVIILRNLTGQEIINFSKTLGQGQNTLRLSSKDLPQGMYLLTVLLEDGTVLTQKVVKE